MNQSQIILEIIKNIRCVADSLQLLVSNTTKNTEDKANEKESTNEKPKVTIEQVRAVMAEKSQEGLTDKVKALLESFGANKLSDVKEENYAALLEKAKEL